MSFSHLILPSDVTRCIDLVLLQDAVSLKNVEDVLIAFSESIPMNDAKALRETLAAVNGDEAYTHLLRFRLTLATDGEQLIDKAQWLCETVRLLNSWLASKIEDAIFRNALENALQRNPLADMDHLFLPLRIAADGLGSGGVGKAELVAEAVEAVHLIGDIWRAVVRPPRI